MSQIIVEYNSKERCEDILFYCATTPADCAATENTHFTTTHWVAIYYIIIII